VQDAIGGDSAQEGVAISQRNRAFIRHQFSIVSACLWVASGSAVQLTDPARGYGLMLPVLDIDPAIGPPPRYPLRSETP